MSKIPKRHSTSSILQISQPNLNKKKKRISFSNNLIFQEMYEDGTTRVFEENFDEKLEQVSMTIDNSDSIFDQTVYGDEKMDFSFVDSPKVSGSPLTTNNKSSLENSFSGTFHETADNFYDSILIFAAENSILELSDELSSQQSIQDHLSTTFIGASLTDGKEIDQESDQESEQESDDELLGFINNSVASVCSTKMVDMSLIDERLWSQITELNEESVSLKFMEGNFTASLCHDLCDKKILVTTASFQCHIESIIEKNGFSNLSEFTIHTLKKPRDDKLIAILKKTVAEYADSFKEQIKVENELNTALKDLIKAFSRLEALFVELSHLCTLHEWKIVCADVRNFEIAFELMGLRYTMWLVMCFDLLGYPREAVKVKFGIHKADLKLYPYHFFHKAMRNVRPGQTNYLNQLVNRAKKFINDTRNNHTRRPIRLSIFPGRKMTAMKV